MRYLSFTLNKDLITKRGSCPIAANFAIVAVKKGESPSDYGYALRRLLNKAFSTMDTNAREIPVIDQFINGLGSVELPKHVQFRQPQTLDTTINLAVEYTAVVGNLDRVTKPNLIDAGEVTHAVKKLTCRLLRVASLRPMEFKPSFSMPCKISSMLLVRSSTRQSNADLVECRSSYAYTDHGQSSIQLVTTISGITFNVVVQFGGFSIRTRRCSNVLRYHLYNKGSALSFNQTVPCSNTLSLIDLKSHRTSSTVQIIFY